MQLVGGIYAYLFIYIASVALSFYMLHIGARRSTLHRIVVVLRCRGCKRTVVKRFEEGDYVGRFYDNLCTECGGGVIEAIYADEIEPLRERVFGRTTQRGKGKDKNTP